MDSELNIITLICDEMNATGHAHTPRLINFEDFDFSGFKEQASDIRGVEREWVRQSGPGIAGDDFQSTVAIPINSTVLFVIECDT